MTDLTLNFDSLESPSHEVVTIQKAIVAGWTSSDKAAVEKHIVELEELGVKRPETTPCYYPVSASRLTTDPSIEVTGVDSSGEVEFVMMMRKGELWIGLGSDHTDRKVEAYDVIVSKQLCDKPVARNLWRFADIADHWGQLVMKSYIIKDGVRTLYQEGAVTAMLHPADLIAQYEEVSGLTFADDFLMYGGTFAAIGGIQMSPSFEYEIVDPVLNRTISHTYAIDCIDIQSIHSAV